jgi:hypothetical protein
MLARVTPLRSRLLPRATLGLALTVLLVLRASSAGAQSVAPSDDERGRTHFQAGRDHLAVGRYEDALREFELAYDLSRRPAMLLNIANVAERLGAYRQAAQAYQGYAETLAAEDAERATYLARAEALRARADRADQEARAEGTMEGTPLGDATTVTSPTAAPSHDLLVPGIVTLVVGGASVIVGAILGGLALAEESSVRSGCGATRSCLPSQVAGMDDLALGADVALFGGLAIAAVGGVLLAIDLSQGGGERPTASARVSLGVGGLVVEGTF